MYFHIILTEKCNSQCRYCYGKSMDEFENGLEKKWEFDFSAPTDTKVSLIKLKKFLKQDKNPKLIFYGGEPLLQIEKIKKITDNVKADFFMQTNGKLLDKLPRKYLERFSKILVSLDGGKQRTDYNRGQGTFGLVMKNVKELRKYFKGELVARMTISQEFPDLYEQVLNLLKEDFTSVHWQIDAGFYKNDFNRREFTKFTKKFNKSTTKLLNFWISEMKKGNVLKFYPFLGIFESIYYNCPTKLRCGSGYANYTITTDGRLAACPIMNNVKEFYCGDLDSKLKEIKKISIGQPCTLCKYLNICGGRCLYSNKAKLWPAEGQKLICKTTIHLIEQIKKKTPKIKKLIQKGIIKESDFEYEKYFGPEIIP